jgi:acyl-CoA synthetase (AMP-forming)/AMP-acid ligase II
MGISSAAQVPDSKQLLPSIYEARAKRNPHGVFTKFPVSSTSYDSGFRSVTHLQALNAINHVAWAIEKSFGKSQSFETIAYLGPNDPRSHIVLIAGIKLGYKVCPLPDLPQQHPKASFKRHSFHHLEIPRQPFPHSSINSSAPSSCVRIQKWHPFL